MYSSYGLLLPDAEFTLEEAETRVRAAFPFAIATRFDDTLSVAVGDWNVNFRLNEGPEVRSESIGFAGRIAGLEQGSGMESCSRRVEVWSDTQDPFLEHFDKYQKVLEVLRSFAGMIPIDPREPSLL